MIYFRKRSIESDNGENGGLRSMNIIFTGTGWDLDFTGRDENGQGYAKFLTGILDGSRSLENVSVSFSQDGKKVTVTLANDRGDILKKVTSTLPDGMSLLDNGQPINVFAQIAKQSQITISELTISGPPDGKFYPPFDSIEAKKIADQNNLTFETAVWKDTSRPLDGTVKFVYSGEVVQSTDGQPLATADNGNLKVWVYLKGFVPDINGEMQPVKFPLVFEDTTSDALVGSCGSSSDPSRSLDQRRDSFIPFLLDRIKRWVKGDILEFDIHSFGGYGTAGTISYGGPAVRAAYQDPALLQGLQEFYKTGKSPGIIWGCLSNRNK